MTPKRGKLLIIRHLREIHSKSSRIFSKVLAETKLSFPQYALLNQLVSLGTLSMTEISGRLHITKPAVTHLVDLLERNRYLKRMAHPNDRRIFLLRIEPQGKRIVQSTQKRMFKLFLTTLNRFNESEQKIIERFYSMLSESLDNAFSDKSRSDE